LCIFGFEGLSVDDYKSFRNIEVVSLNQNIDKNGNTFSRLKYFKALPKIKSIINDFKPDILHAHYASSYGLIGALSGFHPFILSIWGSDVFEFPKKSFINKYIFKAILNKANTILSTSNIMAKEVNLYTKKKVLITPFGIDLDKFKPFKVDSLFSKNDIVIGTIKSLEDIYGIEYLLNAFKLLNDNLKALSLKLLIVGNGSLQYNLKKLAQELDIESQTIFLGAVSNQEVPKYLNMLDVYVALSKQESFGVAIIEASACNIPVVVSDVGGLPEVVENNHTGFIVPKENSVLAAEAIEKLVLDINLRDEIGFNGRERVSKQYDWNICVDTMINIYKKEIKNA
jgi:glycosyltransferase involved in cell wall biosynthesis